MIRMNRHRADLGFIYSLLLRVNDTARGMYSPSRTRAE